MSAEALESMVGRNDGSEEMIAAQAKAATEDKAIFDKLHAESDGKPPAEKPAADEEEVEVESDDEKAEPADKAAYDKAKKNLHLRKIDDELIERLGEDGAIKLWDSLKARELEVNALLQKSAQERKAEAKSEATSEKGEPALPTPTRDFKALREKFSETLGEEAGGLLADVLEERDGASATRVEVLEERLHAREVADLRRAEDQAKVALEDRFPELDDPVKLHRVREKMALLVRDPEYQTPQGLDVEALMQDAARAARLREVTEETDEERETKKKDRETRKAGTAQVAARNQPRSLDPEVKDQMIFTDLKKNSKDPNRVRAALSKYG